MAPSFDVVASSLLCAEDNSSVFDDNSSDLYGAVVEEDELTTLDHLNCSFDGLLWPLMSEDCLALMLQKECQHFPNAGDYLKKFHSGDLDLLARNQAVEWIGKVNHHCGFGPLCAYLSVNYLDRFLSAYEIPRGQAWMMQLLAVACVSLAAKMEETEVPLSLDLQVVGSTFVFRALTIQRMELLVLSTLKWRMRAITPFSFIDHFIYKINDDHFPPPKSLMLRSVQLISAATKWIDFLELRPSEIAAAVAILALKETAAIDIEKAVSLLSQYVEKGSVLKCIEMIREVAFNSGSDMGPNSVVSTVPRSPIGVLDVASLSFANDGSTVDSCANSANCAPDIKRRKLNGPCEVEL